MHGLFSGGAKKFTRDTAAAQKRGIFLWAVRFLESRVDDGVEYRVDAVVCGLRRVVRVTVEMGLVGWMCGGQMWIGPGMRLKFETGWLVE